MGPTCVLRHSERAILAAAGRTTVMATLVAAAAVGCVRMRPVPSPAPPSRTTTVTVVPTPDDWISYNGNPANDRFSPLAEVRTANVGQLRRVCTFDTGETTSFQNGPVVVNSVIYVTTHNGTYAIDGETCALRWKHMRGAPPGFLRVNRGVAYANGRLFRGTTDAHLVAIDAATGHTLWDVQLGDVQIGESIPMAPIVTVRTRSSAGRDGSPPSTQTTAA
jgi:glucose dehydrogenase